MHKAGQPVDEAGKMIYDLWIRLQTRPSRAAAGAVENRVVMWTRATENSRKTPTVTFCLLLTVTTEEGHPGEGGDIEVGASLGDA